MFYVYKKRWIVLKYLMNLKKFNTITILTYTIETILLKFINSSAFLDKLLIIAYFQKTSVKKANYLEIITKKSRKKLPTIH